MSPRYEVVSVRRYDVEGVTSVSDVPDVNSIAVSSVTKPVVVLVPVKVVKVYEGVVLVSPEVVLDPAEKNASSDADPRPLDLPMLGGGLTQTSDPSRVPLDIVTGPPSPKTPPNPRARARFIAEVNSSSRSVSDVVRLREELRLGPITRGSPGYRYPSLETAPSSVARPR